MVELHYAIDRELSADQLAFVERSLQASFDVESVKAGDAHLTIRHQEHHSPEDLRKSTRRFVFIAKNLDKDLIFRNELNLSYCDDPQPILEESRQVIPVYPGFFTFQGDFLRVCQAINRIIRSMAFDLNAIEQEYPTIWPVRLFKSIDYFHEFPQQVIMCAPVKDDFASRTEFATRYARSRDYDSVEMDHLFAASEYGLEPAVCDCCYYGLEGMSDLEDSFYTCYNKVFRNERSGSNHLDRLTNFSVRDIMFVGGESFVLESRQILIEKLSELLQRLMLNAKIETANDPFFANDSVMKSVFQNSHRLKYELLARLPHLDRDTAVGSINFHTDFFGKAFKIRTNDHQAAFSGCIGVGMERISYALFCQHGPHTQDWPDDLRDFLDVSVSRP